MLHRQSVAGVQNPCRTRFHGFVVDVVVIGQDHHRIRHVDARVGELHELDTRRAWMRLDVRVDDVHVGAEFGQQLDDAQRR